jgi:hypothetical protein
MREKKSRTRFSFKNWGDDSLMKKGQVKCCAIIKL